MDDNIAIKIENVSKEYRVYKSNRQKIAHELFGLDRGLPFKALSNINIEIKKGENVGILGNIGSGRTSLAKVIAGISYPTEGNVQINGSIIPVFELKGGFDLNFNGYDNIRIKGCTMGWNKQQIKEREHEIIEFAELEDQIHLKMSALRPVDRMRLGLTMILMDDSDIMVFDSPFQVGSFALRNKYIEKIRERTESGDRTLVMVNVVWEITKTLCERGIVIHNGEIKYDGPYDKAVKVYSEKYRDKRTNIKKREVDNEEQNDDNDDGAIFSDF